MILEVVLNHRYTTPDVLRPMSYTFLSFMMNSHLYAKYNRLAGLLGLPHCSNEQLLRIVGKLEEKVIELAELSCRNVREAI